MGILSSVAKQILEESPGEGPAYVIESVRPLKRAKPLQRSAKNEDYRDVGEGLVNLRRVWSGDAIDLIRDLYASHGRRVPDRVIWVPHEYEVIFGSRGPVFNLVNIVKPGRVCMPLPTDLAPDDPHLPCCFWCSGDLFWESSAGVEKCALCHPPRLDSGFRELFSCFFLKG